MGIKKSFRNLGIAALATLVLGIETDAHKHAIHNIMSHHPRGMPTEQLIKNLPRLVFTRGWYGGLGDIDLNAISLGLEENPFEESEYKPRSLTYSSDTKFYSPGDNLYLEVTPMTFKRADPSFLKQMLEMKEGDVISLPQTQYRERSTFGNGLINGYEFSSAIPFNNCTLSIGKDDNGYYVSFYDVWDYNGNAGYFKESKELSDRVASIVLPLVCEPIHFYERYYLKDRGITEQTIRDIYENKISGK